MGPHNGRAERDNPLPQPLILHVLNFVHIFCSRIAHVSCCVTQLNSLGLCETKGAPTATAAHEEPHRCSDAYRTENGHALGQPTRTTCLHLLLALPKCPEAETGKAPPAASPPSRPTVSPRPQPPTRSASGTFSPHPHHAPLAALAAAAHALTDDSRSHWLAVEARPGHAVAAI